MITYTWGNLTIAEKGIINSKCPATLIAKDVMNDRINNAYTDKDNIVFELRDGAYTDEEIAAFNAGTKMLYATNGYGSKWRAWYGDPTQEQMAGEPWDDY